MILHRKNAGQVRPTPSFASRLSVQAARLALNAGLALPLAAALLAAAPASAEEEEAHKGTLQNWELYGSVRLETAYWKRYKWYEYPVRPDGTFDSSKIVYDTLPSGNLQSGLQNNSYFGVRGQGEKFGYGFEMGLGNFVQGVGLSGQDWNERSLTQNKRQSTLLRKIYGDWYINKHATLRIGQDWAPANFFISNQIYNSDAGLGYTGALYTGRQPLVKLTLNGAGETVGWRGDIAAIKPYAYPLPGEAFGLANGYLQKTEVKVPKVELGGEFSYRAGLFKAKIRGVGGYSQYDAVIYKEDELSLPDDLRATLKSHLGAFFTDLQVWKLGLAFTYATGKNLAPYGVWMGNPDASLSDASMRMFFPTYGVREGSTDTLVSDATTQQGAVVFSVYALPWMTFEAGGGLVKAKHADPAVMRSGIINAFERKAYYANMQFSVADGHFLIVPEFSFSDFGGFKKSRTEEAGGQQYSFGMKLELDI